MFAVRTRFAFSQTSDGRLLVTMEALWGFAPGLNGKFCVSAIDDENTFIHHVVLANLAKEETIDLIANVLLVVSGRAVSDHWVGVTLNPVQLTALGMRMEHDESPEPQPKHPLGFVDEEDLARVFMEAPTAVCMMAGTDHVFTFINPAYLQILGRSNEDVINRPVREALNDLEGQPFFALLDKVYLTGEPFIGVEVPARIYSAQIGATREAYFDFIYHPVRDEKNEVCGILCQSTDVTERVLEKHVRESREEQLYRQWAELDAVYRESPLGLCLIDAKSMKILRLNKVKAQSLGGSIHDLLGRRIGEVATSAGVEPAFRQVAAKKLGTTFEVSLPDPANPDASRRFLWNLTPVFSSAGEVESISSAMMEITEWPMLLGDSPEANEEPATVEEGQSA